MDILWQYGGGVCIGLVAAISPGPDTILVLRSVAAGGARAGARAALGIGSALVVHALVTVLLVVLLRDLAGRPILQTLQLAGALYLAYLGVTVLRASLQPAQASESAGPEAETVQKYFAQGFLTNLTNPKALVFFGSVVSQFITAQNITGGTAMLGGIVMAVPVWFIFLSYGAAQCLRGLSPRGRGLIDVTAGVLFLALAGFGVLSVVMA
jgi:threonine/homoserine/homoserine lactone efflux protein